MPGYAPLAACADAHAIRPSVDLSTQTRPTAKTEPGASRPVDQPKWTFHSRAKFWWKTGILAVATIALIPILLLQHEFAAQLYLGFLVTVHVGGLVVFAMGVKRHDIAPTPRGFINRLGGIAIAIALLYMAGKGIQTSTQSWIFWGSLFAIWLIHTLALMTVHLRSPKEQAACPFV